jgi:spermidine synthase
MTDSSSGTLRLAGAQLVAASFVVLGLELTLIRWLPAQVRVLAYFPNLILISAFLGLGVGCLLASRRLPLWVWPLSLVALAGAAAGMSGIAFTQEGASEHLWLLYRDLGPNAPLVEGIRLPILLLFVLSAASFVPLGHVIATRLRIFREHGAALWGYACDLAGSLAGVIVFSLLFFSGVFPVVWFAIALAAALLLFAGNRRMAIVHVACSAVVLFLVVTNERAQIYSPYYAIRTETAGPSLMILTNGSAHQQALPMRNAWKLSPEIAEARAGYHLPYQVLGRKPRKVLVLGAGSGNDVAVALDEGAQRVDAVEIDPAILALGRRHPDKPYADPRVRAINGDARAFLNNNEEKYDLIVFGTLDSMTRLSALSNVRLDNFVYTVQCIEAARRHLTADGGIVLYFMVSEPYIDDHIAAMLLEGMDERPSTIVRMFNLFNRIYLTGPAFRHMHRGRPPVTEAEKQELVARTDVPTDDWPFLYLRERGISTFYLSLIAAIVSIAAIAVFSVSREMRESIRARSFDAEMFLFGLAFLMIETKLVTEMNLVWGATWLTSAVVFGSILLMVLLGTLWMQVRPLPWTVSAAALVASLAMTALVPVRWMVGQPHGMRLLLSILFIGLPILFASVCFAILFRERERPDVAFGWNMLGAVAGGLLEFSSMAVGIRSTTLLAIAAYLLAMLVRQRRAVARSS